MPAPQSCLIVGRFLSSVADSPEDPDRDPDIVPIAGAKVTLTASVARVRASSAEPPATILMHPIECVTDETGQLVGLDGALGVRVIATDDETLNPTGWTWKAVIYAPGRGKISSTFSAPGGGTVDLTTVIPVPSSTGTELKAWTAAVATTTAARDEAVEAAAQAATAVEGVGAGVTEAEAAADRAEVAQTAAAASQAASATSETNAANSATNAASSATAAAASQAAATAASETAVAAAEDASHAANAAQAAQAAAAAASETAVTEAEAAADRAEVAQTAAAASQAASATSETNAANSATNAASSATAAAASQAAAAQSATNAANSATNAASSATAAETAMTSKADQTALDTVVGDVAELDSRVETVEGDLGQLGSRVNGLQEVRRNLCPRPKLLSAVDANLNFPDSATKTVDGSGEMCVTVTKVSNEYQNGLSMSAVTTTANLGTYLSGAVYVRGEGSSVGRVVRALVYADKAVTQTVSLTLTGAPQRIEVPSNGAVVGGTTGSAALYVYFASPGLGWQVGDKMYVSRPIIERVRGVGVMAGPYFDGDYSPDPDLTPSWTGTANASASILSGTRDKRQDLHIDNLDSRVTKLDTREYYGPHRPDVPSRFTTDGSDGALAALAWINAAPSGSTYYSVDGPQGAWVWRKRGTTWVCVEGNTGPVDLLPKMTADWTATVATLTRTATGADLNIYAIPAASIVGASMATARTMFSAIPLTLWPYPINIGVASFGIHGAGSLALSRNYETPTTFILRTRGSGTFSATEYALANTFPITSGSAWPTTLTI